MNILIVAEKPSAGADIAKVVGATQRQDGYLEGNGYIVTWAVGHLIGLKAPQEHNEELKNWSLETLPLRFPISESLKVLPKTSKQFKVIKDLIHRDDVTLLINAGDAGREGYLIQEWIYRMAGCRLPKKVLWASSLTTAGIQNALDNLKDNDLPDFRGILREAEARAEGDYLLGMNYSRLLTLTRAYHQILSYGRCQTPLLNLVQERDSEIAAFKPEPYWMLTATYSKGFSGVLTGADGRATKYQDKSEAAKQYEKCSAGQGHVVKYEVVQKKIKAPLLYSLAKLQQEMGRKYSFSPDKTLQIAQSLYENHKMLSYPRTDSQHLSMDVFDEIGQHLTSCSFGKFRGLIEKIDLSALKPDKSYFNDHKVTDHHALIPTISGDMEAQYASLSEDEKKVFDAVAISLISIFYPHYRYDATTVVVDIQGAEFLSTGTTIRDLGFKAILKDMEDKDKLQILPVLQVGDNVEIDDLKLQEKMTTAPKKYNDETIIKVMEKYGIGTSATRAEIIKKLQNPQRQFIVREKGSYSVTELGKQYIRIIPEKLKSPELTQHFEIELQKVNDGKSSKESFLDALEKDFRQNFEIFSKESIADQQKIGFYSKQEDAPDYLGKCPKCGSAVKVGKFGAYCTGKCGMRFGYAMGKKLNENQIRKLLARQKILIKGLKSSKGNTYDAYLTPESIDERNYISKKTGEEVREYQYKFRMEFANSKSKRKTAVSGKMNGQSVEQILNSILSEANFS